MNCCRIFTRERHLPAAVVPRQLFINHMRQASAVSTCEVNMQMPLQESAGAAARSAKMVRALSPGLHRLYDGVQEAALPHFMGRAIGELVFRGLYPFSGAFGGERRMFHKK